MSNSSNGARIRTKETYASRRSRTAAATLVATILLYGCASDNNSRGFESPQPQPRAQTDYAPPPSGYSAPEMAIPASTTSTTEVVKPTNSLVPQATAIATNNPETTGSLEAVRPSVVAESYFFSDGQRMGTLEIPNAENLATDIFAVQLSSTELSLHEQSGRYATDKMLNVFDTLGPGHWPGTANPGEPGNAVFGAHNQSHEHQFRGINDLTSAATRKKIESDPNARGDLITHTQPGGTRLVYEVVIDGREDGDFNVISNPHDLNEVSTIITNQDAYDEGRSELTLYTCYPDWTSLERIVIKADLVAIIPPGIDISSELALSSEFAIAA